MSNFLTSAMEAAKTGGGFVKMPEGWNTGTIKIERRKLTDGREVGDVTVTDDDGRKSKSTFYFTEAAKWRIGALSLLCGLDKMESPTMRDMDGKAIDVLVYYKADDKDPSKSYAEFNEFRAPSKAMTAREPEPMDTQPDHAESYAADDDGFAF